MAKQIRNIAEVFEEGTEIDRAVRLAVRDALRETPAAAKPKQASAVSGTKGRVSKKKGTAKGGRSRG